MPCVEVWQTSDLWPLRLGEEKKKKEGRKETTGQKYNGPPITQGGHKQYENIYGLPYYIGRP